MKFGKKSLKLDGETDFTRINPSNFRFKGKKFTIKIQEQEYRVAYGKWYKVEFCIKGIKDDTYYFGDIKIREF